MSDPRWRLINRVRDASSDLFCHGEKLRMHLVVEFKAKKCISTANMAWLREMDDSLRSMAALRGTFRRRRRWRPHG
jgi:hypothetical protein